MNQLQMLVFDIDGVITDRRQYIGTNEEIKTIFSKGMWMRFTSFRSPAARADVS